MSDRRIIGVTYQEEPTPILWVARADGTLIGCTYRRTSVMGSTPPDYAAWHRHAYGVSPTDPGLGRTIVGMGGGTTFTSAGPGGSNPSGGALNILQPQGNFGQGTSPYQAFGGDGSGPMTGIDLNTPAPPPTTVHAVHFDGNSALVRAATPTNSAVGTVAFWFKIATADVGTNGLAPIWWSYPNGGAGNVANGEGGGGASLAFASDGLSFAASGQVGVVNYSYTPPGSLPFLGYSIVYDNRDITGAPITADVTADAWHHVIISWTTAGALTTTQIAFDGVYLGQSQVNWSSAIMNYSSGAPPRLNYDGTGYYIDGNQYFLNTAINFFGIDNGDSTATGVAMDVAEGYFNTAEYLDLSDSSNIALFIDSGGAPVDLGSDGSNPTGTAPYAFFHIADTSTTPSDFETNLGSGGSVSLLGDALTMASTGPHL